MTGRLRALAAIVAVGLGLSGCAPAYHDYPGGCVRYGYDPLPPMPYASYCGCPTPVAAEFQATGVAEQNQQVHDAY